MGDPNIQLASMEADEILTDPKAGTEVQDDQVDETPDDAVEDDSDAVDTKPEGGDTPEEETDNWAEWSKQEGLPDTIDTPEKLAESYKESLREMKRAQTAVQQLEQVEQYLRNHGVVGGIQGLIQGAMAPRVEPTIPHSEEPQTGKTYFNNEPVASALEKWKKAGRIPAEAEDGFRTVATLFDEAVAPQFRLAEQVMTTAMKQVVDIRKQIRDLTWKLVEPKTRGALNRAEADNLIDRGLVSDYEEAAGYLAFRGGNFLRDIANKAEQRGQEKARKKFRRSKALRAEHGAPITKVDYRKFMNADGSWNKALLFRAGKEGDEALEAWVKENKPK